MKSRNNYYLAFIPVIISCLMGCTNIKQSAEQQSISDTISVHADAFEPQTLSDIVAEFERMAKDTFRCDSTVYRGSDTIRLMLRHYALSDTFMVVPEKYTAIFGFKTYNVPEFTSSLQMIKNNITVLDTSYTRSLFFDQLELELIDYGALYYSNVEFGKTGIRVNHSISIPLTDVGENVAVQFNFDGKLKGIE